MAKTAIGHASQRCGRSRRVFDQAMAQLPEPLRRSDAAGRVGVRTHATGATHQFAAHLAQVGGGILPRREPGPCRHPHCSRAVCPRRGGPRRIRPPSPTSGRAVRRSSSVTGRGSPSSGLVDLSGRPAGTRLILRNQRPHPGAQLRITDHDGMRVTGFPHQHPPPGGPGRQLADLELTGKQVPVGLVVLLMHFHAGAATPQGTWGLIWNCATAATPGDRIHGRQRYRPA